MKARRMPLWLGWTLALLVAAGFARLGSWQLARMHEKEAMLDRVAQVLHDSRTIPLAVDVMPPVPIRVEGDGHFSADTLFLDNQQRNGLPGVNVYCVLQLDAPGGNRLVDLGWLPLPGDRKLPDVACPTEKMHVRGLLLKLPSTGIAIGSALQSVGPHRWLMTRVDADAIRVATGLDAWDLVVRLDPKLPIGYARDLDVLPNTLPPSRHLGYAVQWFALSLAVLATAVVLTFRKPRA